MLDDTISHYFNIENDIHHAYKRIKELRTRFYDQSFHTTLSVDPLNNQCFVVERDTLDYLSTVEKLEQNIKTRKDKYDFFVKLLNDLPEKDKEYLFKRYIFKDDIDRRHELELSIKRKIRRYERGGVSANAYRLQQQQEAAERQKNTVKAAMRKEQRMKRLHAGAAKEMPATTRVTWETRLDNLNARIQKEIGG